MADYTLPQELPTFKTALDNPETHILLTHYYLESMEVVQPWLTKKIGWIVCLGDRVDHAWGKGKLRKLARDVYQCSGLKLEEAVDIAEARHRESDEQLLPALSTAIGRVQEQRIKRV